jgi:uncharacterized lipoprotein YddW (UPF0748 family)
MRLIYKIGSPYRWILVLGLWLMVLAMSAQGVFDAWMQRRSPKYEVRAAWLTTLYGLDWPATKATNAQSMLQQQRELCVILDTLQRAGINTVLFQVRTRGAVLYPSSVEPWDGSLTGTTGRNPGYDPLAFAVNECHKRGMELHAWMVTIPYCKVSAAKSLGAGAAIQKHPKWFKKTSDSWYLDPAQTETDTYLASLCREVVERYDVDGIHFDYLRYPEFPFSDDASYKQYGKGMSKTEWRRSNITRIATHLSKTIKQLKPWVKVSASPIGKYTDLQRYPSGGWNAYKAVAQEAQRWLATGVMDALFPMMYFRDNHFFPFAANWQEASDGKPVVPGLGIYLLSEKNWSLDVFTREMEVIRGMQMGGQAYYRAKFLWTNPKGIYSFARDTYYMFPSVWRATEAKGVVAPKAPTGVAPDADGLLCTLRWQSVEDAVVYCLYGSDTYPVDTEDVTNLIDAHVEGTVCTIPVEAGAYRYYAVTAKNRYGMESSAATVCVAE